MPKKPPKTPAMKDVVTLTHDEASRKNIPTAEYESVMKDERQSPLRVAYERRNRDLDPQLVWRGKDEQDWSDLVVSAPPLFIQEKVHPKVLIDDLRRQSEAARIAAKLASGAAGGIGEQIDLFADFNGLPDTDAKTEFYQHDAHWANRLILGDSLQVMASLAEREGLRGKVQCIYIDPPYGIKFNSNFQWSTTTHNVTDGRVDQITREPEQVKAFRDTWRDGIHSYLTYLRDRLTVARDLLAESGSIFVQIGEENVHRIRALMDELFGEQNYVSEIAFHSTSGSTSDFLSNPKSYAIWYAKSRDKLKFRRLQIQRPFDLSDPGAWQIVEQDTLITRLNAFLASGGALGDPGVRLARLADASSQRVGRESGDASAMGFPFSLSGKTYRPPGMRGWRTTHVGMTRAMRAGRLAGGGQTLSLIRYFDESPCSPLTASWDDTGIAGFASDKIYVVQTNAKVIARCVLMTTDPGDLVLDPTCGSGTTAYAAEQWGRRWITIDTSRVALALARARVMGARYSYYLKADSRDGQIKEAEVTQAPPSNAPVHDSLRQGFVYERVPHITLKSIANNAEIDVIWEKFEKELSVVRGQLSVALGKPKTLEEWETLRELDVASRDRKGAVDLHKRFWELRIARQKEIDASIAAKAEFEFLYDKPYEDKKKVRVAGPFTVESLSPHRTLGVGPDDELIDLAATPVRGGRGGEEQPNFAAMILEQLRTAGVQQAHKEDKINFTSLSGWPGTYICAEGKYADATGLPSTGSGQAEKRRRHFHRTGIRHCRPPGPGDCCPRGRRRQLRRADRLRVQL